eukprot:CAMPEP_0174288694 /NCGR_PEP_ID=MMETSP0809-20121228/21905_1 /TAXON_ID=73025 ORGANISM="Eutreptiella gymnastica-like, Strain CCMP1594" /NCGR_SAMPLE_ID=MMETSP0809 /ASSEMBLY_ACC=CAM_ASM_000658 /LENGTH=45 /DNA_ID= /DNA_START= /DNA_END= /DNA_ORIENTATION=
MTLNEPSGTARAQAESKWRPVALRMPAKANSDSPSTMPHSANACG